MYYRQSMEISNIAPMVSLWSSCCVTVDKDGVETVWYRYFPIDCAKWLKAICVYSLSSGSFTLTLAKWVHFPLVAFSHSTPIQMEWNTPLGKWKKKKRRKTIAREIHAVQLDWMGWTVFFLTNQKLWLPAIPIRGKVNSNGTYICSIIVIQIWKSCIRKLSE